MIAEMIDVTGLPDQVVADLNRLVATLRKQLPTAKPTASKVDLPVWEGTVLSRMTREEIYDDTE